MNFLTTNYSSQSYRDRDGFMVIEKNMARRYVQMSYAANYEHLMGTGLYEQLVSKNLLIPHEESLNIHGTDFFKVLEPTFIPFISYPFEWTFDQWKEVALKTLEINSIAIQYGMILKDASPFNFAFFKGNAIFIDTLSFEIYHPGEPWMAYRQFCESILGPMSLIGYCHIQWGRMFQTAINGWDLGFISRNLPLRSWFNQSLLLHIHLHATSQESKKGAGLKPNMNSEKLMALWAFMKNGIKKLKENSKENKWANYYQESILSQQYLEEKQEVLNNWLSNISGQTLIDLGANTGKFSLLAAEYFNHVIALESDIDCVIQIQKSIKSNGILNVDTVWSDLTQPNAGLGWANEERSSIISRLESDCLLALALIHHLCISKNIRLEMVASLFSRLTSKWAIVEFIPKDDPKIIEMLESRKDVFEDFSESNFLMSFEKYFILRESYAFQNTNRKLYLWEKS